MANIAMITKDNKFITPPPNDIIAGTTLNKVKEFI